MCDSLHPGALNAVLARGGARTAPVQCLRLRPDLPPLLVSLEGRGVRTRTCVRATTWAGRRCRNAPPGRNEDCSTTVDRTGSLRRGDFGMCDYSLHNVASRPARLGD